MVEFLEWSAMITGVIAAIVVSANLGIKITGWAFVIYTISSIAWISYASIEGEMALGVQYFIMLLINIFGIYRYLVNGGPDQESTA